MWNVISQSRLTNLVPVGIAVHFTNLNPVGIFVINFIAIIPLAALLSYATEEIAFRTGEVFGGLLNATFGYARCWLPSRSSTNFRRNAVELIVSIIALTQDQVLIVQTSLIGSMLSNLLLVMGMCFFFGGINRVEQHFNITVAQTASSLLALAVGSLIIPTAFHSWSNGKRFSPLHNDRTRIANISHSWKCRHRSCFTRHISHSTFRICLLSLLPAEDSHCDVQCAK